MAVCVDLALAEDRAVVVVSDDPARAQRAAVRVGRCAVVHHGPLPAGPLRELVLTLDRAAALAGAPTVAEVVAHLADRVRAAGGIATISSAVALARWSSRLRTGAPAGDALWPFDGELAALRRGRRAILKRECFSEAAATADRGWLEAAGLTVRSVGAVGGDGRRVSLAARGAVAEELIAAEEAIQGGRDVGAVRALGAALGYPACCVEAFAARLDHGDRGQLAALPAITAAAASPLTLWLTAPLALVSHVPCSLACAATRDLAAVVRDELDRATPGFAARWRALAARLHIVDRDGSHWALVGAGDLARGLVVTDAVRFAVAADDQIGELARATPAWRGRQVTAEQVLAAADHRGDD